MSGVDERTRFSLTGFPGSPGLAVGRPVILYRSDPLEDQEVSPLQPEEKNTAVAMWEAAKAELDRAYSELGDVMEVENGVAENGVADGGGGSAGEFKEAGVADGGGAEGGEGSSGELVVKEILETQRMILLDPVLHLEVKNAIENESLHVSLAIHRAMKHYSDRLLDSGVDWAAERAVDVISVRNDLLRIVSGESGVKPLLGNVIVFADELAPVEMISMSRTSLRGLVLRHAGRTSHAVILAKSLGLPCVTGVDWSRAGVEKHERVMINGENGEIICSPGGDDLAEYSLGGTRRSTGSSLAGIIFNRSARPAVAVSKKRYELDERSELEELDGLDERSELEELEELKELDGLQQGPSQGLPANPDASMACGHPFVLRANVESLLEMERIHKAGAKGVGLFRTESVILQDRILSAAQQEQLYRKLLSMAGNQPVTIRLLDTGGDKTIRPDRGPSAGDKDRYREANPFLGWRGVRMLTERPDLLNDQLEAILRASAHALGRVSILVPMVTFLDEIQRVKEALQKVMSDLQASKIPFDKGIRLGVMIEVPAMALQASEAASLVDFMSIGTNDLIQYTLAVDRGNEHISAMYEAAHPAVWRLMHIIMDQVSSSDTPIHVCGEMASDPVFAAAFVGMGMQELSMGAASLSAVRSHLQRVKHSDGAVLAEALVKSGSVEESRKIIRGWQKKYL